MTFESNRTGETRKDWLTAGKTDEEIGPMLEQALGDFRQCIHAWSEAAYQQPRAAVSVVVHRSWRLAAAWALGCVLAIGGVSGGIHEHHQKVMAKIKAEQEAKQQQLAAQQRARAADEDLLAAVDSDVSREVPAAMEPLAQLMEGDESQ